MLREIWKMFAEMVVFGVVALIVLAAVYFGAKSLDRWIDEQVKIRREGLSSLPPEGGLHAGGPGQRPGPLPPDAGR